MSSAATDSILLIKIYMTFELHMTKQIRTMYISLLLNFVQNRIYKIPLEHIHCYFYFRYIKIR